MGKSFKWVCDIVVFEGYKEEFLLCVDVLFMRVFVMLGCNVWWIGESIFIYFGLLKSECFVEIVRNYGIVFKFLCYVLKESYFLLILK